MAVVHSDVITNALAGTLGNQGNYVAPKEVEAVYTASGALADNTVITFVELPVDARLSSILLSSDDLGTTGTLNVGLYPGRDSTTATASLADTSAVDEDCIATAIDINTAALAGVEIRFEVLDHANRNKKLWEIAGLTTRPAYGTFILAGTLAAATTAGGDISMLVRYRD
jgi:hypothetical protein